MGSSFAAAPTGRKAPGTRLPRTLASAAHLRMAVQTGPHMLTYVGLARRSLHRRGDVSRPRAHARSIAPHTDRSRVFPRLFGYRSSVCILF